jgi:uncharacterized Fe-S cluster-containing radical SAM superfamily enzyme
MEFAYETIKFIDDGDSVRADFLRQFSFSIPKEKLEDIGPFVIDDGILNFPETSDKKRTKVHQLIELGLHNLKNRLTGKPTIYIHRSSGIPLIGNGAFGIVDRNTDMIEVKPITGCNVACVFCSVTDEKRSSEFVVEMEYFVQEVTNLVKFKGVPTDIFINAHGEPTLYADLAILVKNLSAIPGIREISMITNGTLLTPEKIDELAEAGLAQLNFSLNSLKKVKAKEIMGKMYNVDSVLNIIDYAATKLPIVFAPVWVPGVNDEDIEDIIKLAIQLSTTKFPPAVCIQNFLEYQYGSNPVKPKGWDEFYDDLTKLQEKYGIPLIRNIKAITPTKSLPKPFKKGDIVSATIACPGRLPSETIAVAKGRSISVMKCKKDSGQIKVKITRSKHNIFSAMQT